jgi:hypothetical protein
MSTIMIRDLPQSRALDHRAMSGVRGGYYSLRDVAKVPGIKVEPIINVNQNIIQVQDIAVNVLNNNRIIGAGIPALTLGFSAPQLASNSFVF